MPWPRSSRSANVTERWRVDEGFLVGCPVGTLVELEHDGDQIRVVRPYVGRMLSLSAATTELVESGEQLRLTNADESLDVTLTRVPVEAAATSRRVLPSPLPGGPRPDRPGAGPPPAWAASPLLAGRFGPTRLALILGLASMPLVAIALAATERNSDVANSQPPTAVEALIIALLATVVAALVGGTAGGLFCRVTRRSACLWPWPSPGGPQ